MSIPLTATMWIAAVAPIIVLMVLMLGFQWGATKAAPVGLAVAILTAIFLYKAPASLIAVEAGKGLWSAITVLLVVWPAILIYEVSDHVKAFAAFRVGMQKFTPNELLQVIMVGWVFTGFLQGVTGFGVPVAVGAPLLVGLGVNPLYAVVIPLLGHAWGNTFGTLGVAWDALVLATGLDSDPANLLATAAWAAAFIWIWNAITGVAICWFYGGAKALKKGLPAVALISLIQGGGQLLLTQVNQTLACFVPCCIALIATVLIGRTKLYSEPWKIEDSNIMDRSKSSSIDDADVPEGMGLAQAFFPYALLTFITLFVLLIQPVKNFLGQVKIGFNVPETSTGYGFINEAAAPYSPVSIFTHAFTFLILASCIGYLYFMKKGWAKGPEFKDVIIKSLKNTAPSAVAVIAFLVMSRIMGGSGQTVVLARGIAAVMGQYYALFAAVVGTLGSFMTSSNMASNVLFGDFQLTTAKLLGFDAAPILGAQTAGGAIGNTICPGNIILGTTTAGILGKEGLALRKILPLTLTAAVIVGIVLFVKLVVFV